ncbi:MAG TPA: glycosyltransferase [Gemmatimonadales bacterium]|nr:glycosyltransferase [Gemmatimonadales bacterium]
MGKASVGPATDGAAAPHRVGPAVLHVTAPAPVGGLERVVEALAAGQRGAGQNVHVGAVLDAAGPEPPFLDRLRVQGVEVSAFRLRSRAYARERLELAALVRAVAPDVVHTHGYRADLQGGGVARRLDRPIVTTVHGYTGGGWKNRLYERLQTRAFRRFDAVVAVSRPLVARLAHGGVRPERIHLLPNAAPRDPDPLPREEARRLLGVPDAAFAAGWVGRLSREKGADVLVRAIALARDRRIHAVILGSGVEGAALRRLAADLGVAARITWSGSVPEAGRLFTAFDCFVLSSRTEGTPIVLFEAMASATPIVATAVGGVPDVVSGSEALLVASEDPAGLAEALDAVAGNPLAARHRATAAVERLRTERGLAPWVERYAEIYRSVAR